MRILVVSNSDGGLYSFRKELIERMTTVGKVFIASIFSESRKEYFESLGCTCIVTEFDRHSTNPLLELKLIKLYRNIIDDVKPDVVLTYTIKPNVYAGTACASKGIPYIANVTGFGTAVENPGLLQPIATALYRFGLRKATKVFFQNKSNMKFGIQKGIVKENYDLLPGSGVNLEYHALQPYPDDEKIEFAFISRIMKEKGIDQYLDAAEVIRTKYSNTVFHICGSCEQDYEQRLLNLQEKGIIVYHGNVSDVREIHKMTHCTVHPTYYPEGMSNVLLEACANGRPIITTERPGCGEIIEDGINGYVVRQNDSSDVVDKIEEFLTLTHEEKKQMGLNGRTKVEREFDRNIVIEKYMKELETVNNAKNDK